MTLKLASLFGRWPLIIITDKAILSYWKSIIKQYPKIELTINS